MHDIKFIRDNPAAFDAALKRRGVAPVSARVLEIDKLRRDHITLAETAVAKRNKISKEIGVAKAQGKDIKELLQSASIDESLEKANRDIAQRRQLDLKELLETLPNLPADDVPDGADAGANKELRNSGAPRQFNFKPLDHVDIGEKLALMDFPAAAKIAGARFVVLKGALARLERALAQFMLDLHTSEHGYTEVNPPFLVKDSAVYGTGQLPKFADDLFVTTGDQQQRRWLIPTAEVPLTNLAADTIVEGLPWRLTAWTPCFRSEAGASGKDTRGMIRQHQFPKVEMVSVVAAEQAEAEHERMTAAAEAVLRRLGLAFRTIVLCCGDMGFSARKTYDIEVWLPGQNVYREISSCSDCGDFQARRMNARYRAAGEKGTRFVHTLNGSGVAVGRALIAVLENYQQADGSVVVPDALRAYMGGLEMIEPASTKN